MPAPDLTYAAREVTCPRCGTTTRLRPAARFCPHCGGELSRVAADTAAVRALELEAELARLGRDWLAERERHLVSDTDGGPPKLPTRSEKSSTAAALLAVAFLLGIVAFFVHARLWLGLVGVAIVVGLLAFAYRTERDKADAYVAARSRHLARRDVLVRELRNLRPDRDWPEVG